MNTVFVNLQKKAGQNICVRENTAWKENGIPWHRNLCEVSANLVYPIFWQAKSFNQLFSASFLFTSAAHNNPYKLIISVLLDKTVFGVTKIKGKQSMSSLFQIHCHCSGPASQRTFEHLKSVLSAEEDLNWAAFHLNNNNNPAKMFLAFSAQEKPLQKKLRMWMSQRLQYSQEIVSPLISMNLPQDKGKPKAVQFLAANREVDQQERLLCLLLLVAVGPFFPFLIFLQHCNRTGTPQCLRGFYKTSESWRAVPVPAAQLLFLCSHVADTFVPSHRHPSSRAVSNGTWKILHPWNSIVIEQQCNEKTDLNKQEWVWFLYK